METTAVRVPGRPQTFSFDLVMRGPLLMQGLLLLVSVTYGCSATSNWPCTVTRTSFDGSSMSRASRPRRSTGFLYRHDQHIARGGRVRPIAAALGSSSSHLSTGRTASGVLENCVEACLNTLGSFVGGCITGCVIGGFTGGTFRRVPDVSLLKSVRVQAVQTAGSWGVLTAAFSGFTSLSTIIRGKNDKWDQVVGACGAGAFLSRAKGVSGMAQGAATYGLFSLIFASQTKDDPLDVVDAPVDALKKAR